MKAGHGQFLAAAALAILVWWKPLRTLVRLALNQDDYSYVLLVIAVSAALLLIERWKPGTPPVRPLAAAVVGVCAIVAGAWLNWQIDYQGSDVRLSLSVLLFVVFLLAAFFYIYGHAVFAQMQFPLLLLFLAVPLPQGAINWLVAALQHGSADTAHLLFQVFRVPVTRDGLVFSFSHLDVEVAEECSGIRSSTVLFVTTLILARVFLKSGWDRVIAVVCSIPIAIAKNGVRIFTLSILGEYVSTEWLEGSLHRKGGFIFFVLGMATVTAVIWCLRWKEERKQLIPSLARSSPTG